MVKLTARIVSITPDVGGRIVGIAGPGGTVRPVSPGDEGEIGRMVSAGATGSSMDHLMDQVMSPATNRKAVDAIEYLTG
jgi:hypothetical protein